MSKEGKILRTAGYGIGLVTGGIAAITGFGLLAGAGVIAAGCLAAGTIEDKILDKKPPKQVGKKRRKPRKPTCCTPRGGGGCRRP